MDNDRIPVESRAEVTPVSHEPSESEKMKHQLTRIPSQSWRTSCFKSKAKAKPQKRTERVIEDSELPAVQCDYLVLKADMDQDLYAEPPEELELNEDEVWNLHKIRYKKAPQL